MDEKNPQISAKAVVAWPGADMPSSLPDRALSKRDYALLLIVHGLPGLVLLWLLVVVAHPYAQLFATIMEKDRLPVLTEVVVRISPFLLWLLPVGFAVDARMLFVLGRLPRRDRSRAIKWFSLVLIGMIGLDVLTCLGLLQTILRVD